MAELSLDCPGLPLECAFHHIGYATTSLEKERNFFSFLGYKQDGEVFSDLDQGVAGCFLIGSGPRIELLENLPGSNTLTPWLASGTKIYHLAYSVKDLDAIARWARLQRAKVIVPSLPAVAFGGKQICFIMFRNGFLLEFIES